MPELLETDARTEPGAEAADEALRAEALRRLKKKRDFSGHLLVYLLVNGALWAIWLVTGIADGLGFPWPIFPTLFWGLGIVAHAYDAYGPSGFSEVRVRREMDRLRGRS